MGKLARCTASSSGVNIFVVASSLWPRRPVMTPLPPVMGDCTMGALICLPSKKMPSGLPMRRRGMSPDWRVPAEGGEGWDAG